MNYPSKNISTHHLAYAVAFFVLLLVSVFAGVALFQLVTRSQVNSAYEHFESEKYAIPVRTFGKGYTGRVNKLLKSAIVDHVGSVEMLSDTSLVNFVPGTEADSQFLFKSFLYRDLQKGATETGIFYQVRRDGNQIWEVNPFLHVAPLSPTRWNGLLTYRTLDEKFLGVRIGSSTILIPRIKRTHVPQWTICEQGEYVSRVDQGLQLKDLGLKFTYVEPLSATDTPLVVIESERPGYFLDGLRPLTVGEPHSEPATVEHQVTGNLGHMVQILPEGRSANAISMIGMTPSGRVRIVDSQAESFGKQVNSQMSFLVETSPEIPDTLGARLSIDKNLHLKLLEEIKQFAHNSAVLRSNRTLARYVRIAATVMDLKTGEVLAMPSYDDRNNDETKAPAIKNVNLIAHPVGSVFKIILLSTALILNPPLADYRLTFGSNGNSSGSAFAPLPDGERKEDHLVDVLGYRMPHFEEPSVSRMGNSINLREALRFSSSVFAVNMGILGLIDTLTPAPHEISRNVVANINSRRWQALNVEEVQRVIPYLQGDEITQAHNIGNSPFASGICELFNVERLNGHSIDGNWSAKGVWNNLGVSASALDRLSLVCPDTVSLRFDVFSGGPGVRGAYVSWILGFSNNYWTNVKLCEAFARVVSRRSISASFIQKADSASFPLWIDNWLAQVKAHQQITYNPYMPILLAHDHEQNDIHTALDKLAAAMREPAGLRGTASGFEALVRRKAAIYGRDPNLAVLSKTGTPQEIAKEETVYARSRRDTIRFVTRGLYVFTMLKESELQKVFSMGSGSDRAAPEGLVVSVFVERHQRKSNKREVTSHIAVELAKHLAETLLANDVHGIGRVRFAPR